MYMFGRLTEPICLYIKKLLKIKCVYFICTFLLCLHLLLLLSHPKHCVFFKLIHHRCLSSTRLLFIISMKMIRWDFSTNSVHNEIMNRLYLIELYSIKCACVHLNNICAYIAPHILSQSLRRQNTFKRLQ